MKRRKRSLKFDAWLADQKRDPKFRKAFEREDARARKKVGKDRPRRTKRPARITTAECRQGRSL